MGRQSRAKKAKKQRLRSAELVRDEDLGDGLRLQVHRLEVHRDPDLATRMEGARVAAERGDTGTAVALAREVWERRAPGDKFVEAWAGQMLAKYGDPEEAVAMYRVAEGLEPEDWEAYWQVGHFLHNVGLHDRAVGLLEEAVELEPRALAAHLDLARCFAALGDWEAARQCLADARELDPRAKL
jgi:tetratricopeptide (TPR) repeat protein